MTVWVALLRAVNVGGVNRLPMEAFRDALAGIGLEGVRTYIQSGNAVLRSERAAPVLAGQIADAVLAGFGFRPPVLILSRSELLAARAACPFGGEAGDKVHFFFMEKELPRAGGDFLQALATRSERYGWRGKVVWLHLPEGLARSKLARRVMDLPIDVTARNMKSVDALLALAAKLEAA
ncbi:MAG: DUF1697 domain-containing protein [Rhodobacteraceae bacterium]|nr:DUF1697 domain-containing protein [Paracoccaceae bacterium]